MNYAALINASCVDFHGWSTVLQLSGCSHACEGCFNRDAWKSSFGKPFDAAAYEELYLAASKPYIDSIVLQGGDGLFHKNVPDTIRLCQRLRKELPDKRIVLFTGYTLWQIQQDLLREPILSLIDVLVDGKFVQSLSQNPPPWRGSSNQRIYHLSQGVVVGQE